MLALLGFILALTSLVTTSATPPPCTFEDGSSPGQTFPCLWDAAARGNGLGESFVLLSPPA